VGEVLGPTIVWGKGHYYDDGKEPSIAFAGNGTILEIHRSAYDNGLWYHVGQLTLTGDADIGEIDWGDSHQIDTITPDDPAVAVDGNTVVAVYCVDEHLYYRWGTLNVSDRTVDWTGAWEYDQGVSPDIAMKEGVIVEVHQSQNYNTLWSLVGTVNIYGPFIVWSDSNQYDTGTHPSVAWMQDGTLVEVHSSQDQDELWSHVGVLSDADIEWEASYKIIKYLGDESRPTSVDTRACGAEEPAIVIMTTIDTDKTYLRDELAFVFNGADGRRLQLTEERWMELSPWVYDLPISGLRLIGSHDAASDGVHVGSPECLGYRIAEDTNHNDNAEEGDLGNARCQSEPILTQLRAGVRYLDLRVAYQGGKFYSEHIWLAGEFAGTDNILDQIGQFLHECPDEVIIISTSAIHIYSDTTDDGLASDEEVCAYFRMVNSSLPGKLAPAPVCEGSCNSSQKSSNALQQTLRDVLDSGANIIYMGDLSGKLDQELQPYIWPIRVESLGGLTDGGVSDLEDKLTDIIEDWIDEQSEGEFEKDHLRSMSTNIYGDGKIEMAGEANPMALHLMLSEIGAHESAIINLLQINDAVNTPDWVRIFLLNWMMGEQ